MSSHTFGEPYAMGSAQKAAAKAKRLLSASDEDIQASMDARQLPYRRGWPDLYPLPLQTVDRFLERCLPVALQHDILHKAQAIFAAQRLEVPRLQLVYRVPEDVPTNGSVNLRPYLTLLFAADFTKDAHKLHICIVRIRQSLLGHESCKGISIECLHLTCLNHPHTHAILHNDVAVRSKTSLVLDDIIKRLDLNNMRWLCIEVARRGITAPYGECPPTVLITSPTAADPRWPDEILPDLRTSLGHLAPAFRVEVLHASSIFGARRKYKETEKVNGTAYGDTVWMGSSIGIESESDYGATLGGLVVLTGGGQRDRKCALTNWHAVRDNRLDNALSPKTGALDPYHSTLQNKPQFITSPSTEDHRGYLGRMQNLMKQLQKAKKQDQFNAKNREYNKIDSEDRRIGHVHAGSGFRFLNTARYATNPATSGRNKDSSKAQLDFALDWALITIANPRNRVVENSLPAIDPPSSAGTIMVGGWPCENWSTFNVNRETVPVAKVGRTSGWTFGKISCDLVRIGPDIHNGEFADVAKGYGFTADKPGYCFGVVGSDGDFIDYSDSGSILVHNDSGAWLGLCFGRTGAGHGMFIPIDRVWQDIKSVTSQEVRVPSFVKPETIGLHPRQLDPTLE